jgi:hypothetical protein
MLRFIMDGATFRDSSAAFFLKATYGSFFVGLLLYAIGYTT